MAYIDTGFKRSMKVKIIRTGNDDSVVETIYDGQDAFGLYTAIASDDDFRRLERNGVDGDWDVRLSDFKDYIFGEVGEGVYALIDWDNAVVELDSYEVRIMQRDGGQGEIVAVLYLNDNIHPTGEDLYILLSFDGGAQDEQFIIPLGQTYSNTYSMTEADIDLNNVSSVSVSPTSSQYGMYSVIVDTVNEI